MNVINQEHGEKWSLYCGDSCEVMKGIPDNSVGMSVYSPPFSNLYVYSQSMNDLGNSRDFNEFFRHYRYIIREKLRITIPGRVSVVHCKDLPAYANRDDYSGLFDFPGMIVRLHERCGWRFHSRVTIWKCPVTERERTNNHGLLHATAERDRSALRQGMADYLLVFRKQPSGKSALMSDEPVVFPNDGTHPNGTAFREYVGEVHQNDQHLHPSNFCRKDRNRRPNGASIDIWRRYAEPVWWDINQTEVLNGRNDQGIAYTKGREEGDERHICPLQLGVIRRSVQIWSNPGDVVFTPFAGVGSEIYQAVLERRRGVGIELKESYFRTAVANAKAAEASLLQGTLLEGLDDDLQKPEQPAAAGETKGGWDL